jgi:uncharacterized protein (TIRG00374 family)
VVSIESIARLALRVAARVPGVRAFAPKLEEFYLSTAALLRPGPLVVAVLIAIVAWACECLAFWLIVRGFPGASVAMRAAFFIYATMTVAGALSFLPGGLGVTELGMLELLGKLGTGTGRSVAAAATFITRACTLWFAVIVGLVALLIFSRRMKITLQLPDRAA